MELTSPVPKEILPTTTPSSNEDKRSWCELGQERERELIVRAHGSDVTMFQNPSKRYDKFAHDMFWLAPMDLKSPRTEFRTADRYGVDPRFAVTLNLKDVERYSKLYPNICIVFDVRMEHYANVHVVLLQSLLARLNRIPVHNYIHRSNDGSGNATASYVIDCRTLPELKLNPPTERKK